jgi:hypothetical protein
MLIFDIETFKVGRKDYIWEFAAVDNKSGLYAHWINGTSFAIAKRVMKDNPEKLMFFGDKQLKHCNRNKHRLVKKDSFIFLVNRIIEAHKVVAAYNIEFDKRHLEKNGVDFSGTRKICLWGSFINSHVNSKYFKWAFDNEYVTEKGNPRTDAETAYRYVTDIDSYSHQHFALSDCWTEATIWEAIAKRKGKLEEKTSFWRVKKQLKKYGYK